MAIAGDEMEGLCVPEIARLEANVISLNRNRIVVVDVFPAYSGTKQVTISRK